MGKKARYTRHQAEILGIKDPEQIIDEGSKMEEVQNKGVEDKSAEVAENQNEEIQQEDKAEEVAENQQEDPPVVQAMEEQPVVVPVPVVEEAYVPAVNPLVQGILSDIESYIVAMAPRKPVTDAQVNQNQIKLFRAIQRCVEQLDVDFTGTFAKILALFEEHKTGVFHETRIYRGMEIIELSQDDRNCFMRMINLLKGTSNVQARSLTIKQIDMARTLQYSLSDAARNRIMNFYNV